MSKKGDVMKKKINNAIIRILRIVTLVLAVIFSILTIIMPFVGNAKESDYRAQIEAFSGDTADAQALFDKMQYWSDISETPVFLCIFTVSVVAFFAVQQIERHVKNRENK